MMSRWFLLPLMLMTPGYQLHDCLSLLLLLYLSAVSALFLSFPPLCLQVSLFLTSLSFPFPLPLFLLLCSLFLSLLHKHLSSLRSRGWQDKKHVSIRKSRKGRIDSETKEGFTAVYKYMCVWVCTYICVPESIPTCMHSCLSRNSGLSAGRDRKCSKTWMIALPLNTAQIQPAKQCFHEIRWMKFMKTLTLQTWAKKINISENIFSCLKYFNSTGLYFSYIWRS